MSAIYNITVIWSHIFFVKCEHSRIPAVSSKKNKLNEYLYINFFNNDTYNQTSMELLRVLTLWLNSNGHDRRGWYLLRKLKIRTFFSKKVVPKPYFIDTDMIPMGCQISQWSNKERNRLNFTQVAENVFIHSTWFYQC